MSTNADLASWGEPPATPAEEALATLLDKVMAKLEQGKVVKPQSLKRSPAELKERGQQLVQAVSLLYECAASVWENSSVENQAADSGRYSTLNVREETPPAPGEPKGSMKAAKTPQLPDPFPGEFRLRRLLGEGAFGKVWLADDLNLGWQVALKTLRLPSTSTQGPHALAALRKEAQHLAKLHHPNIVQVHAWRQAEGEHYLVLEYVAGGSLADRLKKDGPLDWQHAARYIADVGEGLLQVHEQGIIHRDIKPANILWNSEKDEAMLTDFGVSARLAEPGTMAGTPIYMAPEAFEGRVTPALDVYSLAATLFHLITGELPFEAAPIPSLVYQILQGLPDPDPRCQGMPEPLERLIRDGLAAEPARRPKLDDFIASLRGSLNQLLADSLVPQSAQGKRPAPVNLKLVVSREVSGAYQQVAATKPKPARLSRDMKKVPSTPEQVRLRTGDRVRIEVVADKTGYVTVFNVGPTGNLNVLYPDENVGRPPPSLEANTPLHVLDVEMTPPIGHERLFAVWSREPLSLKLDRLASLIGHSKPIPLSTGYRTTRDMSRVKEAIQRSAESHSVVVLEMDHQA